MQRLFVDTAAWIGLEVVNDEHHPAAEAFRQGSGRAYRWVTTNWVLWEAVTWLRRRAGHASSVRFGERLLVSDKLEIVTVTPRLEMNAWEMFRGYQEMNMLGLTTAFTFDEHFRQAGFRILPQS